MVWWVFSPHGAGSINLIYQPFSRCMHIVGSESTLAKPAAITQYVPSVTRCSWGPVMLGLKPPIRYCVAASPGCRRQPVLYILWQIKTISLKVKDLWLRGEPRGKKKIFIAHIHHEHAGNLCHSNVILIQGSQIQGKKGHEAWIFH